MRQFTVLLAALLMISGSAIAQCETFDSASNGSEALEAHSLYREYYKNQKYKEAFPMWEKAYEIAPAANGKTSKQYRNGVTMLSYFIQNEADETKKAEMIQRVLGIFDAQIICYPKEKGEVLADKASFLFYYGGNIAEDVYSAAAAAHSAAGNKLEYFALYPYAMAAVTQFTEDKISEDEARAVHAALNQVAEYQMANAKKDKDKENYSKTIESVNATFDIVAEYLFDCDYFKDKLTAEYEANPDDYEVIKNIRAQLVRGGCEDSDPLVAEIKAKMLEHIKEVNDANAEARWESMPNANKAAVKLQDGDYKEAIDFYKLAISETEDPAKKGDYAYAIAQAYYKLKEYSSSRSAARDAAKYKPNWGKPYMLIGNLYASSTRSCGDAFEARMVVIAALEKYSYAKAIDSEVADDANKRISRLSSSKPSREDAFQRGLKDGQSYTVGCWIQETVTISTIKGY